MGPAPVDTELSFPPFSPSWLVVHHFLAGLMTVSFGSWMPASWQARSPSAAYWALELSPTGGPWRFFSTGVLWTTLGFWRSPATGSLPLATAARTPPPVGVPSTNGVDSP